MRSGRALPDIEEAPMRTGQDEEVWLSTSKQPLRDFDGRIIGIFGISRDITARKHAERELVARTAELDRVGRELRNLIDSSPDSNNHGRVNGWTGHDRVFGICVAVDGVARAGAAAKVRPAPATASARTATPSPRSRTRAGSRASGR
jgi:PAS fold